MCALIRLMSSANPVLRVPSPKPAKEVFGCRGQSPTRIEQEAERGSEQLWMRCRKHAPESFSGRPVLGVSVSQWAVKASKRYFEEVVRQGLKREWNEVMRGPLAGTTEV